MSSVAAVSPKPVVFPMPLLPIHRFTVAQYHRMIATGVLTENDRVELLEGWIVDKMPQHPAHAGTISVLLAKLQGKLPKGWIVRVQSPITLDESEPEPDLAIVTGPEERYLTAHPTPEDIAIVIEVADSSVEHDRTVKGRAYARARLPIYWIVNLVEQQVEIYTQPRAGKSPSYRHREDFGVEYGVPILVAGREVGTLPVRHFLS
ncbi:MAG TPA: Uma2 family endonuclease [Gemmataceae bacterium]|nr:Uma2 family endonuclease [Gemmataceae bacterium]